MNRKSATRTATRTATRAARRTELQQIDAATAQDAALDSAAQDAAAHPTQSPASAASLDATTAAAVAAPYTPTAADVAALLKRGHIRSALPPKPGHRPRGRPRKDGQPPRQSTSGAAAAATASAAADAIRQSPAAHVGTLPNLDHRTITEPPPDPTAPAARFADITLENRIENLKLSQISPRARTFLEVYARTGHRDAMRAAGVSAAALWGMRNNPVFAEIYDELQKAHDAATVANTSDTLAALANGEYKPRPDCLPPDMRAASLLLPALDQRFRPSGQVAAQAVQINISI